MASLEAGTGEPHPRLWPAPGSRATPMADHVLLASPAGPVPAVATLHDLAAKYNVSAERIRQLEKNAMNKLKGSIQA